MSRDTINSASNTTRPPPLRQGPFGTARLIFWRQLYAVMRFITAMVMSANTASGAAIIIKVPPSYFVAIVYFHRNENMVR